MSQDNLSPPTYVEEVKGYGGRVLKLLFCWVFTAVLLRTTRRYSRTWDGWRGGVPIDQKWALSGPFVVWGGAMFG